MELAARDRVLVLLVDKHDGEFYAWQAATGRLERLEDFADDVPRPTKGASWAGLADDKVARHIEEHVHNHFKRVLSQLEHYLHQGGFEAIMLGGPHEVVTSFIEMLPHQISEKVLSQITPEHHVGIKALEEQVRQAMTAAHGKQVEALLGEIEDNRSPDGRGLVGQEPVYEALNLKQVQALVLASDGQFAGLFCPKDGALSTSLAVCPLCTGPMTASPDLLDRIRDLARAQAARVFEAQDLTLPAEYEQIAALKRYSG